MFSLVTKAIAGLAASGKALTCLFGSEKLLLAEQCAQSTCVLGTAASQDLGGPATVFQQSDKYTL